MAPPLPEGIQRLVEWVQGDALRCQGVTLPARRLRYCGPEFQDDAYYLASAIREADRLVDVFGLGSESRLLDVGCGVGRLATGILRRVGELRAYVGVDVSKEAVRWCRRHIARRHPRFRFLHLDVQNLRYNPDGIAVAHDFRLPFEDEAFDLVYAYSVFSHLPAEHANIYLRELRRLLAPEGRVFLTAFLEEGVPAVSVNPEGYRREWSGPLHCVRYEQNFFEGMLAKHGLALSRFEYGRETDGQSALYVHTKRV